MTAPSQFPKQLSSETVKFKSGGKLNVTLTKSVTMQSPTEAWAVIVTCPAVSADTLEVVLEELLNETPAVGNHSKLSPTYSAASSV